MRFCMVTTFYPPYHYGGDGTYVRALAVALVARGHEVTVVHCEDAYRLRSPDVIDESEEENGVRVIRLKSKGGFLSPLITQQFGVPGPKKQRLQQLFDQGFDVVNFHNISLVGGPGVVSMSKAPVNIYTLHEHWLLCPTHIFWKNKQKACDERQCIRCCVRSGIPPQFWRYTHLLEQSLATIDAFVSPSEYTKAKHQELLNLRAPIKVIPLFSNLSPPVVDRPLNDVLEFLYVGRITASKGVAELLSSFAKWPDFRLKVIGEGDLLAQLRQTYDECTNIEFTGALTQEQLIEHYANVTALILPSLAPETFGLTVVEAFACGTPAIVRSAGGSREMIDQSGAGFVYHNEEQLLQSIRAFADDQGLRHALGLKARRAYEESYTAGKHVDSYLDTIDAIFQKKAKIVAVS